MLFRSSLESLESQALASRDADGRWRITGSGRAHVESEPERRPVEES